MLSNVCGSGNDNKRGIHMISKAEALQKLKKTGMVVSDDQSIVTILLPTEVPFEKGLKEVKEKLKEIGYESSFCVKQSKDSVPQKVADKEAETDNSMEATEELSKEELSSYMAVDSEGEFSLDDDGQFSLGFEF